MRSEPDIDRQALMGLLRDRYALAVSRLEFVPHGIDSWSYVAIGGDGSRTFVKVVRRDGAGGAKAGRDLALLSALADLGRVPVARPIADRDGEYLTEVDGFRVQVLEYLDGRTLEDESAWPEAVYGTVADIVAAVHASTEQVGHLVPRTERYELPFVPGFLALLNDIVDGVTVPAVDDVVAGELRGLIAPRAGSIQTTMARLQALRDHARARAGETVLCHTDIWGSNLILSPDGSLHLVDWDGALIGPPEADLLMFAGTGFFPAGRFAEFLDRYEAAFRPIRLDPDVLGFYLYRRNLEDLADFVDAVATGRSDAMTPAASLALVGELLVDQAGLEAGVEDLRGLLGHRSRG